MTIEQLKDFYSILRGLFYYDSKSRTLSMALNEVGRRYVSAVSKLKCYLVQNYYSYGVTDVTADRMFDERRMKFIGDNSYSFITVSRDSTLAALDKEVQQLGGAYVNIREDYYDLFDDLNTYVGLALTHFNKNGYTLTEAQKSGLRALAATKAQAASLKGSPAYYHGENSSLAAELENGRSRLIEYIRAYINFLYKSLTENGYSQDFCPLVETAYVEALADGRTSTAEILRGLSGYNVPKRNSTYVKFRYAD